MKLINFPKKYFWITLVSSLFGLLSTYGNASIWTVIDYIEVLIAIVALIGLNFFDKKKKVITLYKIKLPENLTLHFWQGFLWIRLITLIPYFVYIFTPKEKLSTLPELYRSAVILSSRDSLIVLITSLLPIFALLKLAYGKHPWENIKTQITPLFGLKD